MQLRATETSFGRRRAPRTAKRLLDLVGALAVLLVAAPVLVIVALLVWTRIGRPILFTQERPGLHGRMFRLFKFRTMANLVDASGRLLPDAERLTSFGKFLRRSSLDELPQLFNVLRGDMSLVGPRPLLAEYLPLYTPIQYRRHEMKPGITGWAQISGRNELSWNEKFRLDVLYIDRWSLWVDVRILAVTVLAVLRRTGITQYGHATVERFYGSEHEQAPAAQTG